MKTCPDCAEQIQDAARVCRYCGYRFADPAHQPSQPEPADGEVEPDDSPRVPDPLRPLDPPPKTEPRPVARGASAPTQQADGGGCGCLIPVFLLVVGWAILNYGGCDIGGGKDLTRASTCSDWRSASEEEKYELLKDELDYSEARADELVPAVDSGCEDEEGEDVPVKTYIQAYEALGP